jgi:hypothetical protein
MNNVSRKLGFNLSTLPVAVGTTAILCASPSFAKPSVDDGMPSFEDRIAKLENDVPLRFGAGVETLFLVPDSSRSLRDRAGFYWLDKFEVIIDGEWDNGLYFNARWDYQVTQQAFFPAWTYAGLKHNDEWSSEVGIIMQPLGAGVDGSYYDNSFLSDVPLWLGLANNPDPGIKTQYHDGEWHFVGAFTKNTEVTEAGPNGNPNARFRPDVDVDDITTTNTFHGGGAYTIDLGGASYLQLGSNAQVGKYYNEATNGNGGDHWAATAFANYKNGGFGLTLQGLAYDHDIKGSTDDFITMTTGKKIPADGQVYSTRVSYSMPADLGIYDNVKFFHDFDYLVSGSEDPVDLINEDAQFSIVGVHLSRRGGFNTWVSVLTAQNADFANGGPNDNGWNTQFNVVGALYF